jgi:DNA-binding transcriptional MerR regulator
MNIEDIIKLKEAGFTAQEIKELMNNSPQEEMKVEEKDKLNDSINSIDVNKIEEKNHSGDEENPEINAFETMMKQFEDSMNEQMKAFKETIQLSNNNANIQSETPSGFTAEDVVARIINPYTKK